MRRIELRAAVPAPVRQAYAVLLDTPRWPQWSRLVLDARGELRAGAMWAVELRDRRRPMRPRLVSVRPPRAIVFETTILDGAFLRIRHQFEFRETGPEACELIQDFEIRGFGARLLWPHVRSGARQFDEFGRDLSHRFATLHECPATR